ncbi:hypothetical protein BDR04DRAFT_791861 [Suillus decipiens]|nr:hypothetical protein BDR04DRAFT_791861 [Suillus decipiens]
MRFSFFAVIVALAASITPLTSSHHPTQIMRFFFFAVIFAFAASIITVSACSGEGGSCSTTDDCCPSDGSQCILLVSRSSLTCIKFSPDNPPFAPCNIRTMVVVSAFSDTLGSRQVPTFAL